MLDTVISFLKDRLQNYIRIKTGGQEFLEVVYIQRQNQREVSFKSKTITILLVNIEEDYTFRSGAAYEKMPSPGGNSYNNPTLYLNLYVLFAANFDEYDQSLKYLSLIIKFFQSHRLFDRHNSPNLNSEIEKLILELVNLPFTEQREIWAGLGVSYLPSVIYKVRMIAFTDEDTVEIASDVAEKEIITSNI